MVGIIDEIMAAVRPPSVNERRQLALLALDMAGEAARVGDHAAASMFLADAEVHLHALIQGARR